MALTVVSSYGGGTSNSYIAVTDAATIKDEFMNASDYTDASTTIQGQALIRATRMIDAKVWKGCAYYYDQNLQFPRSLKGESNFEELSADVIGSTEFEHQKKQVKWATVAQAIYLLRVNTDLTKRQDLKSQGISNFSLGQFSESYGDTQGGIRKANVLCEDTLGFLIDYKGMAKLYRR